MRKAEVIFFSRRPKAKGAERNVETKERKVKKREIKMAAFAKVGVRNELKRKERKSTAASGTGQEKWKRIDEEI